MTVSLHFLLILTLITGTESAGTISKVSMKAGASVSIPCPYSSQHRNNVKYLCEGYYWNSCSYAIKTNSQHESEKYSISDDQIQRIFNVTIKRLTVINTYYWCAVEIKSGPDDRQYFHLSVTKGTPSLFVDDQKVTGFIGESMTINCHSRTSGIIKWCKLHSTCVADVSGLIDGTTVTINMKETNVFSVTMSGLRPESSGWYYCTKGDFQMPVHLTVTTKPTAAPTTVTGARENATEGQNQNTAQDKSFPVPISLIILLGSLIFIVIVALSFLFILRTKRPKIQDSTASKLNEGELVYSEVTFKKTNAAQDESGADVTYNSVTPVKQEGVRRTEAKDEDVTYNTVIHHKQNV
ncbi:polymeric immunoglobulin receptor-like isoform X2 [Girardinichthys multiradiatus]|uniref:polymeric immunoglobulin receptor-like isoform X2 n=1 Tax=Girardinichthys multiradiatus TaxID=208333 RepID=UPI001FAE335F|nr:polymeric immunoglobulin receptor-like isoform X2 [Girardinichthys multiradiatus]